MLVLAYGSNALSGNWLSGPTSNACIYMGLVYATVGTSGGHLNPAVSLAVGVAQQMPIGKVLRYCLCQCLGGLLGALTFIALFMDNLDLGPRPGFSWGQAAWAEMLHTGMLCFVFLNCVVALRSMGGQFFGIAVGFAALAGGYAAGPISGGCLNPAVVLGVDILNISQGFGFSAVYFGSQMVGAALAGALFRLIRQDSLGIGASQGWAAALMGEFVGTFWLVLALSASLLATSAAAAWSAGGALVALFFSLWDVSGAHLNPAVTLAVLLSGAQLRSPKAGVTPVVLGRSLLFMAVQLLAGLLAVGAATLLRPGSGTVVEPLHYSLSHQALAEASFTALLCFVLLATATDRTLHPLTQYAGLAVGLCVVATSAVLPAVSGGSANPAATLGLLAQNKAPIGHGLVLVGAQFLGAALAAGLVRLGLAQYQLPSPELPQQEP